MLGLMWRGNLWRFSDLTGERFFGLLDIISVFLWYLSINLGLDIKCQAKIWQPHWHQPVYYEYAHTDGES